MMEEGREFRQVGGFERGEGSSSDGSALWILRLNPSMYSCTSH